MPSLIDLGYGAAAMMLAAIAVARATDERSSSDHAPQLEVSIAVPTIDAARPIFVSGERAHFHVVLRNPGPEPVRIWREGNSWGHGALSFEIEVESESGKRRLEPVRRRAVPFLQNAPMFATLAAGESRVTDVYFASGEWETFPLPEKGKSLDLPVRAIYEVPADKQARQHGVWTGRVASPMETYRLEDRR